MNENLPISNILTQHPGLILDNPVIAVTGIVTLGFVGCVLIIAATKHNKNVELKIGNASLTIYSSVPAVSVAST